MIILPKTHAEWLDARENGIGASDAGVILGVSKWKSNVDLWLEKTGQKQPEDISDKPYVKYGHDAEQFLRGLFALDHPEYKVTYESPYKMIFSDDYPFIFCTPDGELEEIATGRRGGLEIKTTEIMNSRQWSDWAGRIPDTYYAQVLHQMLAADWEFVRLRAQIKWHSRQGPKATIIDYLIERNDVQEDIEWVRDSEISFWNSVLERKQPGLKLPEI